MSEVVLMGKTHSRGCSSQRLRHWCILKSFGFAWHCSSHRLRHWCILKYFGFAWHWYLEMIENGIDHFVCINRQFVGEFLPLNVSRVAAGLHPPLELLRDF